MKKHKWLKRLLLLIVVVLVMGGAFLGFRNYQILKQVHQYDDQVAKSAKKYQVTKYQDLLSAIIFTETKGKHLDVMQSSESVYGEAGKITDSQESIDSGVAFFAQALKQSQKAGCDLWTAVQAYNFGLDYIAYVQKNGGENSVDLAEDYSRDVLSPILGNDKQEKYRYWDLRSLFHNGGFLYHNGGNMFYAEIVRFNEWKIKATAFLF